MSSHISILEVLHGALYPGVHYNRSKNDNTVVRSCAHAQCASAMRVLTIDMTVVLLYRDDEKRRRSAVWPTLGIMSAQTCVTLWARAIEPRIK